MPPRTIESEQRTEGARRLPGVIVYDVAIGSAELQYDPALVSEPAITKALGAAGFAASVSGRAALDANVGEKGGHCGIAS